jgi:hypothetical protein
MIVLLISYGHGNVVGIGTLQCIRDTFHAWPCAGVCRIAEILSNEKTRANSGGRNIMSVTSMRICTQGQIIMAEDS